MRILTNAITLLSVKNASTKLTSFAAAVKGAKRNLLLQAARDEFIERGLEGATMRGIALKAGCTTGAIYPVFESKEVIYAALLSQSLQRLDDCVARAVGGSDEPASQVRAACRAFTLYYLEHSFEVNLGLYAFRGLKRQGVGKDSDRSLNNALRDVLERIAIPLATTRHTTVVQARAWVALLFSQMIGGLVLQLAGRLDVFATDAQALVDLMLEQAFLPTILPTASRPIEAAKPTRRNLQSKPGKSTATPRRNRS